MFRSPSHIVTLLLGCLVSIAPLRIATAEHKQDQTVFRLGGYDAALFDAERLDIEISFALVLNQILEQMEAHADFTIYDTFEEVSALFATGEIDGMFCSIGDCPKLSAFDEGQPMYGLLYNGAPTQEYVLVTSISNEEDGLGALRNKILAVPNWHQLGERIANIHIQEQTQQNIDTYFARVVRPDSSQTALIDLVFGKVDAAVVTRNELNIAIELNPQMASSLSALYVSPPVILNLMVISPKARPGYRELFATVVENITEYSQSQYMLQLYGADGITLIRPQDIASTLEFFR
ncbi:MAG: PhnD/SsuA/transferrin family substrate-binding protein [Pseudomonadota bacterium]